MTYSSLTHKAAPLFQAGKSGLSVPMKATETAKIAAPAHRSITRPSRRGGPTAPVTKVTSFPLVCRFCGDPAEAVALQNRLIEGRPSVEYPVLVCEHCHETQGSRPDSEEWSPYWNEAPGSRLCCLPFRKIQCYKKDELSRLWSLQRFAINEFHQPRWIKTLWRIWFLGRKPKDSSQTAGPFSRRLR